MKKVIYFISVVTVAISLNIRTARAFILPDLTPPIPCSVQLCAMCIAPAITKSIGYVQQIVAVKDQLMQFTDVSKLKQMLSSYISTLGNNLFNELRRQVSMKNRVVSYSRTIEGLDGKNEVDVKNDFVVRFLQYPSDKEFIKNAYRQKSDELKMDVTLEMYITASEMLKELNGTLNTSTGEKKAGMVDTLNMLETCMTQGKEEECSQLGLSEYNCLGDEKEEETCYWNNALRVARLYDKIMRYNEYLISMQAEYRAVLELDEKAQIREYEKDSSLLMDRYKTMPVQTAYSEFSAQVSFAADDLSDYMSNIKSPEKAQKENFESGTASGNTSDLDGKEEDFESLGMINEIQELLEDAKNTHNMKQVLPEYKSAFKTQKEMTEYYNRVVESLQQSGECVQNFLSPYYSNVSNVWYGKNCAYYKTGSIYCHYSPERSITSQEASIGEYDIPCPNNTKRKCYVQSVIKTKFDKGIIGYLTTLYQKSKDADALEDIEVFINAEDDKKDGEYVNNVTINSSVSGQDNASDEEEDENYVTTRDRDGAGDGLMSLSDLKSSASSSEEGVNFKSQKNADDASDESRKSELVNWAIGADVIKQIVADLNSSKPRFGNKSKSFPLWNDQIKFYNQYVDGKYKNIKDYITYEPFAKNIYQTAQKLNAYYPYQNIYKKGKLVKTADEQRNEMYGKINSLKSVANGSSSISAAMDAKRIEGDNRLLAAKQEHVNKLQSLNNQKESLYAEIDRLSAILSKMNTTYNKSNETINSADQTSSQASAGLEYSASLNKNRKSKGSSPFDKGVNDNRAASEKAKTDALSAKEKARQTEALETTIKSLKDRVKKIEDQYEKEKSSFVYTYSRIESEVRTSIANFDEDKYTNIEIVNVVNNLSTQDDILGLVAASVGCAKQVAGQIVDEAVSEINNMKLDRSLYYPANGNKLVDIHKRMISRLKGISLSQLNQMCPQLSQLSSIGFVAPSTGISAEDFAKNIKSIIADLLNIFKDVCDNNYCETPDSEYFVGSAGKKRDFKAPKAAVNFSSAPLREIFHFDLVDYEAIEKFVLDKDHQENNANIIITTESVLNSGLQLPEIWYYILRHHAFIEKDIDLTDFFGVPDENGNVTASAASNIELMRSGIYPCVSDGQLVDSTGIASYSVTRANIGQYIQKCQSVKASSSMKKVNGKNVYSASVYDREADVAMGAAVVDNVTSVTNGGVSELSYIFAYLPDKNDVAAQKARRSMPLFTGSRKINWNQVHFNFSFNANLQKAVQIANNLDGIGENKSQDAKYYSSDRVFLKKNQLGDYLNQLEMESVASDSLIKANNKVEEIKESMRDLLNNNELDINDSFNLLNDNDYNAAAAALDKRKMRLISEATGKINQMNGSTSTINYRKNKLLHQIKVMLKDSDERVVVSGDEDLSELEEKIRNSKADNAIKNEYNSAGDDAMKKEMNRITPAYCAVYSN